MPSCSDCGVSVSLIRHWIACDGYVMRRAFAGKLFAGLRLDPFSADEHRVLVWLFREHKRLEFGVWRPPSSRRGGTTARQVFAFCPISSRILRRPADPPQL